VTLAVLLAAVSGAAALAASGWRVFEIRTGSMSPTMPAGDAVLDRPVQHVHRGQVVTYRGGPDGYTTHRVVAVTAAGIETKGDANRTADWGQRTDRDIAGRVVIRIPYGGYVLRFAHNRRVLVGLLLLAAAVLLAPPQRRGTGKLGRFTRPRTPPGPEPGLATTS
jgi:signal peptidase